MCLLGLAAPALADDKEAKCPGPHRHMGHGLTGVEMKHDPRGFENAKRIAHDVCSDCHGKNGISQSDEIPNLAGQEDTYLCKSLEAYRLKVRVVEALKHIPGKEDQDGLYIPSMNEVAEKLSDQDILDLSEYYTHMHEHHAHAQ